MSFDENPETTSSPESAQPVKVESLTPNSKQVNTTVKVVSRSPIRETISRRDGTVHKVTDALVGDETGSIYLTLWDDNIENVKDESTLDVKNGYVSLFKGSMRLNIGRYGKLEASSQTISTVNTTNNLSDKQYEQPERFSSSRPRYGGGGGGYGGRGRDDRGEGRGGGGYQRFGSRRRF
ncbi:MAG: single-stranded DNA-binding protein [Candidatus Bathyarchaeota archaeon]|jgi:replication factor A1|nr:single-stranded DNA-binding protein [Candidatus Bathyarchaeota archaeon]